VPCLHEYFLAQVVSMAGIAAKATHETAYLRLSAPHEFLECSFIAGACKFNDGGFREPRERARETSHASLPCASNLRASSLDVSSSAMPRMNISTPNPTIMKCAGSNAILPNTPKPRPRAVQITP